MTDLNARRHTGDLSFSPAILAYYMVGHKENSTLFQRH